MKSLFRKNSLRISITVLSILGYGLFVFAATGPFAPGEELNPSCSPGELNCYVEQLFATTNSTYTWIGNGSGQNGGSTDNTFFAGIGAGDGASNADYSNFIGTGAGTNAVNANNSNFFGQSAGCNATNADNSNFFGQEAGCYATEANNSNFFGNSAGWTAVNAAYSTFFGDKAGYLAADATRSNFIGYNAGAYATGAYNTNLMGYRAGMGATNAHDSTFLGYEAGSGPCVGDPIGCELTVGAVGASNSVMMGYQSGYNELSEPEFLTPASNPYGLSGGVAFIGYGAGYGASSAVQATFIGYDAGYKANTALGATILGYAAGYNTDYSSLGAPTLDNSLVLGTVAGQNTTNVSYSTLIGTAVGTRANNLSETIVIGQNSAASDLTDVYASLLLGNSVGNQASDIVSSVIIGRQAGGSAENLFNSIVIGSDAGWGNAQNTKTQIIYTNLTGGNFTVGGAFLGPGGAGSRIVSDNGIDTLEVEQLSDYYQYNPGDIITSYNDPGVTAEVVMTIKGTASIMIGANTSNGGFQDSIALGTYATNTSDNQFLVGSGDFPIDQFVLVGTGGATCATDANGTACSSDENLKKNIVDLNADILDKLTQIRTVTFNWKTGDDTENHIGFIAQDIQEFFPELVSTGATGYLSVNYAGMTPILTEAIRELNLKIENIDTIANTMNKEGLIAWFGDVANGIGDFFSKRSHTETLCVGTTGDETCITKTQLDQLLSNGVSSGFGYGYGGN